MLTSTRKLLIIMSSVFALTFMGSTVPALADTAPAVSVKSISLDQYSSGFTGTTIVRPEFPRSSRLGRHPHCKSTSSGMTAVRTTFGKLKWVSNQQPIRVCKDKSSLSGWIKYSGGNNNVNYDGTPWKAKGLHFTPEQVTVALDFSGEYHYVSKLIVTRAVVAVNVACYDRPVSVYTISPRVSINVTDKDINNALGNVDAVNSYVEGELREQASDIALKATYPPCIDRAPTLKCEFYYPVFSSFGGQLLCQAHDPDGDYIEDKNITVTPSVGAHASRLFGNATIPRIDTPYYMPCPSTDQCWYSAVTADPGVTKLAVRVTITSNDISVSDTKYADVVEPPSSNDMK